MKKLNWKRFQIYIACKYYYYKMMIIYKVWKFFYELKRKFRKNRIPLKFTFVDGTVLFLKERENIETVEKIFQNDKYYGYVIKGKDITRTITDNNLDDLNTNRNDFISWILPDEKEEEIKAYHEWLRR